MWNCGEVMWRFCGGGHAASSAECGLHRDVAVCGGTEAPKIGVDGVRPSTGMGIKTPEMGVRWAKLWPCPTNRGDDCFVAPPHPLAGPPATVPDRFQGTLRSDCDIIFSRQGVSRGEVHDLLKSILVDLGELRRQC